MTPKEREKYYKEILDSMEYGKEYTAASLGVAPASMTAMTNRGMVDKIKGSPMRYMRKGQKPPKVSVSMMTEKVLNVLKDYPEDSYFSLGKEDYVRGILCVVHEGKICSVNDYMKPVEDYNDIKYVYIKGKKIEL